MMIGTSEVPVRVCRGFGKPNLGTWPAFLARLCLCTLRHSWDTLVGKSGDEASTLNHARWFLSIHSIAMAMARVIMMITFAMTLTIMATITMIPDVVAIRMIVRQSTHTREARRLPSLALASSAFVSSSLD